MMTRIAGPAAFGVDEAVGTLEPVEVAPVTEHAAPWSST